MTRDAFAGVALARKPFFRERPVVDLPELRVETQDPD